MVVTFPNQFAFKLKDRFENEFKGNRNCDTKIICTFTLIRKHVLTENQLHFPSV